MCSPDPGCAIAVVGGRRSTARGKRAEKTFPPQSYTGEGE